MDKELLDQVKILVQVGDALYLDKVLTTKNIKT
jgi:hypothetical protein